MERKIMIADFVYKMTGEDILNYYDQVSMDSSVIKFEFIGINR